MLDIPHGAARRRAGRLLPILLVFMLSGCPFTSEQPLSYPSTARLDPALAGVWRTTDPETGESNTITFLAFDEHELVACTPGDSEGDVEAYRVHATAIGAERFLNVMLLGEGGQEWYFVNYRIEGSRMTLRVIDEGLFGGRRFSTPADLREFVGRNLSDPRLYAASGDSDQAMTLERVEASN